MFRSLGRFSNCWNFSLFYIFHLSGIVKFKTPECPCEPPPEPLSDSRGSLNFYFSWRKSAKVGLRRFCQYRFKMKNGVQRTMKHFDKLPCQRSWRAFLLGRGYLVVVITCSKKAPERVQAAAEYSPIIQKHRTQIKTWNNSRQSSSRCPRRPLLLDNSRSCCQFQCSIRNVWSLELWKLMVSNYPGTL